VEADVAIVGAGIAGLYAAWRLAMAGGKRIHLFEASDRLGGRIHKLHPAPGLTVELGAQSIRDDHGLLLRLLRRLDVATTGVQNESQGLVHLRGRTRSLGEIRKARWRRPFAYDVAVGLQRGGPARLLRTARQRSANVKAPATALGQRLSQSLSAEKMAYLSDRSGYGFWTAPVDAETVLVGVVRHFGAEDWRNQQGMGALAMFADAARGAFWRGTPLPNGEWLAPGHPAMAEIQRMVAVMYGQKLGREPPAPMKLMIRDWIAAPFGGAFHLWAAGSKPTEAAKLALQPVEDMPIHICGEAWSSRQAWIEGALETAESVLCRHFQLPAFLDQPTP
jgi:monoamine oxidase